MNILLTCRKHGPLSKEHTLGPYKRSDYNAVTYRCKHCSTERSAKRYAEIKKDPDKKEKRLELQRKNSKIWHKKNPEKSNLYRKQYLSDPKNRKKHNQCCNRYNIKHRKHDYHVRMYIKHTNKPIDFKSVAEIDNRVAVKRLYHQAWYHKNNGNDFLMNRYVELYGNC